MAREADSLIKNAEDLFKQRKLEEALQFYNEAGVLYRRDSEHKKAAYAFSQAAFCEKLRTGLEPLLEAANLCEMAAREAVKDRDYAFARWQFREAGLIYEREGDFERYSHCFMESQDIFIQYLLKIFFRGEKQIGHKSEIIKASLWDRLRAIVAAFFGIVSRLIWGYGERPFRTFAAASLIMAASALIYWHSGLVAFHGVARPIDFAEAIYFSGVTFSTLGYGDYVPLGWTRWVALGESLSGFVIVPLFMISMTRRYLRVYR